MSSDQLDPDLIRRVIQEMAGASKRHPGRPRKSLPEPDFEIKKVIKYVTDPPAYTLVISRAGADHEVRVDLRTVTRWNLLRKADYGASGQFLADIAKRDGK